MKNDDELFGTTNGYNQKPCKHNHGVVRKLSCNRAGACGKCAWNEGNGIARKRLKDKYGYVKEL